MRYYRSISSGKIALLLFVLSIVQISCQNKDETVTPTDNQNENQMADSQGDQTDTNEENVEDRFTLLQEMLQSPPRSAVLVMAHRGDWRNAPENSLQGIENCIALGVDIVEVDVQRTKDDKLVLMHDTTLDRTTNGTGEVSGYTLDELKKFKLKLSNGNVTSQQIPTLEEAMMIAKEEIFVFVDKGYEYLDIVYQVLSSTGTLGQSITEGIATFDQYKQDYPDIWDKLIFAPRAGTGQSVEYITEHANYDNNVFLFTSCNLLLSKNATAQAALDSNRWLVMTTLSSSNCSEAFGESTWESAIEDLGVNVIVTDKPLELVTYLKAKNRRE